MFFSLNHSLYWQPQKEHINILLQSSEKSSKIRGAVIDAFYLHDTICFVEIPNKQKFKIMY